jgi:hypothetical protein
MMAGKKKKKAAAIEKPNLALDEVTTGQETARR